MQRNGVSPRCQLQINEGLFARACPEPEPPRCCHARDQCCGGGDWRRPCCGGEGECATSAEEALVNARCASTLAALGGGRVLRRGGRWADPQAPTTGAGQMAHTQTRCFLGCGDGEEGSVLSKVYEERRVMGYSPEQMFAVVAAVDFYEDFVPWCQRSRIIRRHGDGSFNAELEIGFKFLVESYVSHVVMEKPKYIKTTASESELFDHLINVWEFKPGPVPGTCDLYFLVDFKFKSPLYHQVASMYRDAGC